MPRDPASGLPQRVRPTLKMPASGPSGRVFVPFVWITTPIWWTTMVRCGHLRPPRRDIPGYRRGGFGRPWPDLAGLRRFVHDGSTPRYPNGRLLSTTERAPSTIASRTPTRGHPRDPHHDDDDDGVRR